LFSYFTLPLKNFPYAISHPPASNSFLQLGEVPVKTPSACKWI
jgi:hypothetical protein